MLGDRRIAFIGGGHIAEIIVRRLTKAQVLSGGQIVVSDPKSARRAHLADHLGVVPSDSNVDAAKAGDLVRTGCGQPQFMNANVMVQRLLDQYQADGITLAEARRGGVAGCVSTGVADKTAHPLEGAFCVAKPLELALYDGKDPLTGHQIGPKTGAAESFESYEALYEAFLKQMEFGTEIGRNHGKIGCMLAEEILPLPLRSTLTEGCIENGSDCWAGVANFTSAVYYINGAFDAANYFACVKKLVFDEKKLTMAELKEALEAKFE